MEGIAPKIHDDHFAGKEEQFTASFSIWFTNLVLCPKQRRYLQPEQQRTNNWKNLRIFRRGVWRKSETHLMWSTNQEIRVWKYILHQWWISVVWRIAELEKEHQKYKGRVALRGDIVNDDSGSYAVFTEQGSSPSQMAAAKVMEYFSRLPGCAGQAADAASSYTQVRMEDAPKLLKIQKSEGSGIWIRLPRHKWPKSWSSMEDPVDPLEWKFYGHPLA